MPGGTAPEIFASGSTNRILVTGQFSGSTSTATSHNYFQYSARGTVSSPSAVQANDAIGGLRSGGYGATSWSGRRANLLFWAAENWTDTAQGAYITFETTTAGTSTQAERMRIDSSGNVGIGTTSPQHLLHVAGTIGAEAVIVSSTGADYVFQPGYRLRPLSEVSEYIKEHQHLPDIPSAKDGQEKGVSLGDMQTRMLAKIEELTLHMIAADENAKRLATENETLQRQNAKLQRRVLRLENLATAEHASRTNTSTTR